MQKTTFPSINGINSVNNLFTDTCKRISIYEKQYIQYFNTFKWETEIGEDTIQGWMNKLDWMNIVAKLKMKRFILHPIASHCWSYNYCFDFSKASIVFSPISISHLNFYEAYYILKNSNNLVNY